MAELFVSGLPEGIDDETFSQLFEGSGTIVSCTCVADQKYGFVKYASANEAQSVVEAMNGFEFGGASLQLRQATAADLAKQGGGKGGACKGGASKGWGNDGGGNGWGNAGGGNGWGNDGGGNGWGNAGGGQSWGKDGGKGGKDSGKGGKGKDGGKGKGKFVPQVEAEPSDNLYIKGLPVDFTQDQAREVFGAYGTVVTCKVMPYANDASALLRMGSIDMATWMVENLDGNMPQGLATVVSVRYADSAITKAKKMQGVMACMPGADEQQGVYNPAFGKAGGKGKGDKSSPYGQGKGGKVQYGNMDPNLDPDIKTAVDSAIMNLGGKGRKRIAHEGDESNLYVKDLPGSIDECYIYKLFSPFGALESVMLKKGDNDAWAIAFVKYMTNEDAAKAILGLTNCLLPDGSMPKVSIKVSKPGQ